MRSISACSKKLFFVMRATESRRSAAALYAEMSSGSPGNVLSVRALLATTLSVPRSLWGQGDVDNPKIHRPVNDQPLRRLTDQTNLFKSKNGNARLTAAG